MSIQKNIFTLSAILLLCLASTAARAADQNWSLLFEDKLATTEGIAVCPDGTLYTSELKSGKVYEIKSDTELELYYEGLEHTAGMVCGADNMLVVLEYAAGRAVALSKAENGVQAKILSDKLKTPNGVAMAADGTLYISETDNARVVTLAENGDPVEFVSGIPYANGLAFNGDETLLYINSTTGGKVMMTPLTGANKGKVKSLAKGIQMADGIIRAPDGTLFAAAYAKGEIVAISPAGQTKVLATGLTSPASPAIWNGALYVTSLNGKGIYKMTLPALED